MRHFTSVVLACAIASAAQSQVRSEIVRGRVTSDSGVPISGAVVSATKADRSFRQDSTNAKGEFRIQFDSGTGDYLVHATAIGYKPLRLRVTAKLGDSTLTADFKLAPNVTQLAKVAVTASKLKVSRSDGVSNSVGSVDKERDGVYAMLTPGQEGDLLALAGTIPGISASGSAFGLDPSQNSTTLNGLAFAGTSLPRDAAKTVGIATSPFDPARGGFSGAQTNVSLQSGQRFYQRRAHVTLDVPQLQTSDPIGAQIGQRTTQLDGSIGGAGPLFSERFFYNNSLQLTRTSAASASLTTADDELLLVAGVAPDSVRRLMQVLTTAGIPLTASGIPSERINQSLKFASRFDRSPWKPGTYDDVPSTFNISTIGNYSTSDANGFSPTSLGTRAGSQRNVALTAQGVYSRMFDVALNETRAALNISAANSTPYLRAPGAVVSVLSVLPGDDAVSSLAFGGNSSQDFSRRQWNGEVINETQWYTPGTPHRIKITSEARYDGYSNSGGFNSLGTYSYASLAAIASNSPTSFTRTLASPTRRGGDISGYFAIGDYWRKSPTLRILYGARIEGNRFTTSLASNPAVASAFNARTDFAPNRLHVSPRLAFTWYQREGAGGNGVRFNSFAAQSFGSPNMVVRGGIGEFRSLFQSTLLSDASVTNGLSGYARQLTCLGDAIPTPQWSRFVSDETSIPSSCMSGSQVSFADAAPSVRVFDRSFDAPRSWRATLGATKTVAGKWNTAIDGTYSLNLDQPGITDLNFAGVQRFTLPDEGGRPLYVNASSIVTSSGAVASADSRVRPEFGRVVRSQSDLRSSSRQLTVSVNPNDWNRILWSLSYTILSSASNTRGFDGTTFYSPVLKDAATTVMTHQLQGTIGAALPYGLSLSLFARLSSGSPYTPIVGGDINGDGLANDRAFIFDPSSASDPAVAAGLRSLLATAPAPARDCLASQIGRAASANSCRGPWTTYMNARIGLFSISGPTRRSISGSLNISNPLAGIDQLVHGSGDLHGWGTQAFSDPVLYNARGFDPATSRFRYEVNPRFGSSYSSALLGRSPVRLTLDVNIDLGIPIVKQQVMRLMVPGRAGDTRKRLTPDSVAIMLRRQVPNLYTQTIALSDSLLLSREQVERLNAGKVHYQVRMDSLWKSVGERLAAEGDSYDVGELATFIDDATEAGWIIGRDELPTIEAILSPLQFKLGPWTLTSLKGSVGKKKVGMRVYFF